MGESRWAWADIPHERGWHPVPTHAGSLWWVDNPNHPDAEGWSVIDLFDHTNPSEGEVESRDALVAAVRDAPRVSTLRRLAYELAHGNRPQLFEGRLHWYSADENREHHFLNQPLTDAEVAEWALICEVGE